jgi:sugar lactone lactonase YvrE
MDDLFRSRLHEVLDLEPTPHQLRARVMQALPAERRLARRRTPNLDWTREWVAFILAIAVVAGLLYFGRTLGPQLVHRTPMQPVPAFLSEPYGIAVGPDGALYFSDFVSGYVFRRLPDASIETIAGTRPIASIEDGDSGMGGPASRGYLFGPAGLAFDRSGNLYISDSVANRVRRIDTHGVITTFAGTGIAEGGMGALAGDGGPAKAARLNFTYGLAVDAQGNLYIADNLNGKIRRVDKGGRISSLDDSTLPIPQSQFRPDQLAFDSSGNLYVLSSDFGFAPYSGVGCTILRRTPSGSWSIVAGRGLCGFGGDGGPATDAKIMGHGGLAFDAAGNLYFSDSANHRIRRIDRAGVITTVISGLGYPQGIAFAPDGRLYVEDLVEESITPSAPGRILELSLSESTLTTLVDSKTTIHTSG